MPLPAPLETATITGTWESPVSGGPLVGTASLVPLNAAVSPAGDVLLTTSPGKLTLANGVASWPGVLLTDSTGLSNRVPYRLIVKGTGYYEDRTIELLKASVVAGTIKLSGVATATPGPALVSYLLAASRGVAGGVASLGLDGKVPTGQLPASSGGGVASVTAGDATIVVGGTATDPTVRVGAIPESAVTSLVADLAARQPLDADLTAIAALAPADGSLIQRVAGVWNSQTTAQVKASLGISYADVSGTVPTSALPPLAINETTVVADQAAMLALTAQRGDMAIRQDNGRTYVLSSDSPGTLADWKEVLAAGQVQSVAGKTGVVTLVKADVGLNLVDNTSDLGKPVSTATQTALDGKPPRVQITDPMTKYGIVAAPGRFHEFMGSGGFGGQFVVARTLIPAGVSFSRMAIPIRSAGTFTPGSGKPNQLAWWDDTGVFQQATPDDDHMWDTADWYVANLPGTTAGQATDRYVYAGFQISGVAGAGQYVLTGAFDGGGVPFSHAPGSTQRFGAYTSAVASLGNFNPATVGTLTSFIPFIGFMA